MSGDIGYRCLLRQTSDSSKPKPVELVGPHSQQIRQVSHTRKNILAKHFDQNIPFVSTQVEFYRLSRTRKIIHYQDRLVAQFSNIGEYPVVGRVEKLNRSRTEYRRRPANPDDVLHPGEQ